MVAGLCRVFDPSHSGLSVQALTTYFEAKNPYWHLAEREGSSNVPVNEWKSQYAARMEQLGLTDHRETAEELINAMLDRQCDCTSEAEAVFWLEETRTRHGWVDLFLLHKVHLSCPTIAFACLLFLRAC